MEEYAVIINEESDEAREQRQWEALRTDLIGAFNVHGIDSLLQTSDFALADLVVSNLRGLQRLHEANQPRLEIEPKTAERNLGIRLNSDERVALQSYRSYNTDIT